MEIEFASEERNYNVITRTNMQAPLIYEFLNKNIQTIKTGPFWNRKTVKRIVYTTNTLDKNSLWKSLGFKKEYSPRFNDKLIKYFERHPPRVGDVVYIEAAFRILKVVWNFNHNRYHIWWMHDSLYLENDLVELLMHVGSSKPITKFKGIYHD